MKIKPLLLLFTTSSSSNASPSEGAPLSGSYGCTPHSLPKFWHPSHDLLRDNGFTQQGYHKYLRRCLNGEQDGGARSRFSSRSPRLIALPPPPVTTSVCCVSPPREEAVGHRSVAGDEHSIQVLVLLPEGQLQQEDVRGVQTAGAGRRQRKLQVRRLKM